MHRAHYDFNVTVAPDAIIGPLLRHSYLAKDTIVTELVDSRFQTKLVTTVAQPYTTAATITQMSNQDAAEGAGAGLVGFYFLLD
jgi:hypothetical protein